MNNEVSDLAVRRMAGGSLVGRACAPSELVSSCHNPVVPGRQRVGLDADGDVGRDLVAPPGEGLGRIDDAEPGAFAVPGVEHPGLEEELERGIVRGCVVPRDPADKVVARYEAPQGAVGVLVEPDHLAHLQLLVAGGVVDLAGTERIDHVARGPSVFGLAYGYPEGTVLLHRLEDVV